MPGKAVLVLFTILASSFSPLPAHDSVGTPNLALISSRPSETSNRISSEAISTPSPDDQVENLLRHGSSTLHILLTITLFLANVILTQLISTDGYIARLRFTAHELVF